MLQSVRLDLVWRRFTALYVTIPLSDDRGYVDASDYGARMQVRAGPGDDGPPLLDFTVGGLTDNGSGLSFNAAGALVIDGVAADSVALPLAEDPDEPRDFAWDVIVVGPDLRPITARFGVLTVVPSVTREPPAYPPSVGALNFNLPSNSGLGLVLGLY